MTSPTTVNVLYIGTRPIMDTTQGANGVMEGASALLGHYDVGTDAVYHTLRVQHDPAVVDGLLATNDYGALDPNYPDGYYDEGFSNTVSGGFSELDSQQLFLGTVTYRDIDGTVKTMEKVPFNVYQLENGDTYLAPTTEIASPTSGLYSDSGEFYASVLSGRDILSVELDTLRTDAIGHDNLIYDYESVQDQVQTFYLGNKAILDTTQGNGTMENAGSLLGGYDATAGTPGEGQFTLHTLNVRQDAAANDGLLGTNDYGAGAAYPDGLLDDGYSNAPTAGQNGTTFSELDSQQLFWGDVYYIDADGNEQVMHNVALNVYQLENGDVFAVPTTEIVSESGTYSDPGDTSPSVLAGLAISRIELTSMRNDPIGHDNLLYDSESIAHGTVGATLGIVGGSAGDEAYLNDLVEAGAGNDTVHAGLGGDTVYGGLGDDDLSGDGGADSLLGEDGADALVGGAGADVLEGGAGDDDLAVGGADTASGGSGDDIFTLDATDPATDLAVTIDGGSDATDGNPDDAANGNSGDVLDLGDQTADLTVALGTTPETGSVDGLDADNTPDIAFTEIEGLVTGAGNDTIDGATATGPVDVATGGGDDSITTGTGDDIIDAGDGNDTVAAGGGDDSVLGDAGDDLLEGDAGNDTLDGGADADTLYGGEGQDSLLGGSGDDALNGGDDADTLSGGTGDDVLAGDAGNDSILGGEGNDTADGGDGDDYINTRTSPGLGVPDVALVHPSQPGLSYPADTDPNNDRDSVSGGVGNDTILTGDDGDIVYGGVGSDSIDAGFDSDLVHGGDHADMIEGNEGADTLHGDAGDDLIFGGLNTSNPDYAGASVYDLADGVDPAPLNNADLLYGGDGNDTIHGQDDADTLYGDGGDDLLYGGIDNDLLDGGDGADSLDGGEGDDSLAGDLGNDTLDGGAGADPLSGGDGADIFVAEGADRIVDFDTTTGMGDDDASNNDAVDLSAFYNETTLAAWNAANPGQQYASPLAWMRADQADGVLDGADGLQIQQGGSAVAGNALSAENTMVVCFTAGTRIATQQGEVAIEDLQPGDRVLTMDNGYQPIRWIGSTRVRAVGNLAPILFRKGTLNNSRDLMVSPQHRMLLTGSYALLAFGENEVLAAAKHLVNDHSVIRVEGGEVEYFHILFDSHQIIFAEGCPSESFHPGEQGLGALAEAARQEIFALFPQLSSGDFDAFGTTARLVLKGREARLAVHADGMIGRVRS